MAGEHPKDAARRKLRPGAAFWRESVALELYAQGRRNVEIAERIDVHPGSVSGIVRRALERRVEEEGPSVAQSKALYLEQLRQLIAAYWPLATGTFRPDEDTPAAPPDVRAGELLIKLLDRQAAVLSRDVQEAIRSGTPDIHVHLDMGTVDKQREQIMDSLARLREKGEVIDGELANVGTTHDQVTGLTPISDQPAPPPQETPDGTPLPAQTEPTDRESRRARRQR